MFEVRFYRNVTATSRPGDYALLSGLCFTLEEAREKRSVSGDIVVDVLTGKVPESDEWMWDWEKKDKDSYAQRVTKFQHPNREEGALDLKS